PRRIRRNRRSPGNRSRAHSHPRRRNNSFGSFESFGSFGSLRIVLETAVKYPERVNDSSTIIQRRNDPTLVPRAATLDGFVEDVAGAHGIHLRDVEPLTTVVVLTHNSRYRILITDGTAAIVRGGAFFPEPTAARIDGSSCGGTLLKVGWIGVGLRMEICANGRRIITSPGREVGLERSGSIH